MKTIIAATLALLSISSAAVAEGKPDYLNNKKGYACENEQLALHLKTLYSDENRVHVLYVKNAEEISRTEDGLQCSITMVHSRGSANGIVEYIYQDGHALFGFEPTRR